MKMVKKDKSGYCCAPMDKIGCCKVESLISVDERGQMVLPKEIRDKADEFADMVKEILGPMMKEILQGD
jgi:hypothetical protein